MKTTLDIKRIIIFLAVAFGWSYASAVLIWRTGGLFEAQPVLGGLNSFASIVALLYMPAPAIAHVVTRWITGEGWQDSKFKLKFGHGKWYWLTAWLGTPALILIGAAVFYALFPQNFDPNMTTVTASIEAFTAQSGQELPFTVPQLMLIQAFAAVGFVWLINAPFTFGEEFGWRAYLQPKLMPLGPRRAMLLMGLIWGLWHAPVIYMGYNYGSFNDNQYWGSPWSGILMMCWMTFTVGTFFGWLTFKADSVWPAVIGHSVLNGFAAIVIIFAQGDLPVLLGPAVTGIIGSLGFGLVTLWLFVSPQAWVVKTAKATAEAQPVMPRATADKLGHL